MPRWYALCNGHALAVCDRCRRNADHHPTARDEKQQAWVAPDLLGNHCRHFIEQPPKHNAITPTDRRA